jgi:hypothetical protein
MPQCPECAEDIQSDVDVCPWCNCNLEKARRPAKRPQKDLGEDPAVRMLLPVGRSPLAIIAGYLGLLSILGCFAPLAIIFGILAIYDIRKHPEKHGMGRAIFGIVAGTLMMLLMIVFFIVAAANSH